MSHHPCRAVFLPWMMPARLELLHIGTCIDVPMIVAIITRGGQVGGGGLRGFRLQHEGRQRAGTQSGMELLVVSLSLSPLSLSPSHSLSLSLYSYATSSTYLAFTLCKLTVIYRSARVDYTYVHVSPSSLSYIDCWIALNSRSFSAPI